jgi:hypothetical protein
VWKLGNEGRGGERLYRRKRGTFGILFVEFVGCGVGLAWSFGVGHCGGGIGCEVWRLVFEFDS